MTRVFADTSYFVALLSTHDANHQRVIEWSSGTRLPIVTTEFVLAELANLLSSPPRRQRVLIFLEALFVSPTAEIVVGSSALFHRAVRLYSERMDKHWSLTDCASFIVMGDRGMSEALTFDKHFEQAGFSLLPK